VLQGDLLALDDFTVTLCDTGNLLQSAWDQGPVLFRAGAIRAFGVSHQSKKLRSQIVMTTDEKLLSRGIAQPLAFFE